MRRFMRWGTLLWIGMLCSVLSIPGYAKSETRIYYSDEQNPPVTDREPPYFHTRKQVKREHFYLNIRYPYQASGRIRSADSAGPSEKVSMKFSVGNELIVPLHFKVTHLVLKSKGRDLKILPFFDNQQTLERESGLDALYRYSHQVMPSLYQSVWVDCLDCSGQDTLNLEIAILVIMPDKQETVRENILLYRGDYVAGAPEARS